MRAEPLPNQTAGAVIRGIDSLATLSDGEWAEFQALFKKFGFLVVKDTALSSAEQVAFGQRFGNIEFAGVPMANTDSARTVVDANTQQMRTNLGNEMWHTDSTYKPISSKIAMLSARMLPPSGGGQTGLLDMRAGYARLDAATRERIGALSAYHSTQFSQANDVGDFPPEHASTIYHGNSYLRPLVKFHPDTGEPSIFVARHAFGACRTDDPSESLPREESRALLAGLVEHALADERAVYVHEWTVGDTLVWDNRRLLHRAFPYNYNEPRVLLGTRVEGGFDCLADNLSGETAGEVSVAAGPDRPFGLCGRAVLEEELVRQRQDVEAGARRMLAASLPESIVPGTTVELPYVSAAQAQTLEGQALITGTTVPALSPAQQSAARATNLAAFPAPFDPSVFEQIGVTAVWRKYADMLSWGSVQPLPLLPSAAAPSLHAPHFKTCPPLLVLSPSSSCLSLSLSHTYTHTHKHTSLSLSYAHTRTLSLSIWWMLQGKGGGGGLRVESVGMVRSGQTLALLDDGCDLTVPEWQQQPGQPTKVVATYNSIDEDDDCAPGPTGYHGTSSSQGRIANLRPAPSPLLFR